jgi:hypothetical protein
MAAKKWWWCVRARWMPLQRKNRCRTLFSGRRDRRDRHYLWRLLRAFVCASHVAWSFIVVRTSECRATKKIKRIGISCHKWSRSTIESERRNARKSAEHRMATIIVIATIIMCQPRYGAHIRARVPRVEHNALRSTCRAQMHSKLVYGFRCHDRRMMDAVDASLVLCLFCAPQNARALRCRCCAKVRGENVHERECAKKRGGVYIVVSDGPYDRIIWVTPIGRSSAMECRTNSVRIRKKFEHGGSGTRKSAARRSDMRCTVR